MEKIFTLIKLLRVWQWLKNCLIFIPYFLSYKTFDLTELIYLLKYFILFSLFVSGTYILNDIKDLVVDREHPVKRLRPIASKKIELKSAKFIAYLLVVSPLILLIYINELIILNIFITYFLLTSLYTFKLKFIPYLDSVTISLLFLIRILLGSFVAKVELTLSFILYVMFVSLFISLLKKISIAQLTHSPEKYLYQKNYNNKIKFKQIYLSKLLIIFVFLVLAYWIFERNVDNFNISSILFIFVHTNFTINLFKAANAGKLEDFILELINNKSLLIQALFCVITFYYFYF